jgi:cell division protein FtsZ
MMCLIIALLLTGVNNAKATVIMTLEDSNDDINILPNIKLVGVGGAGVNILAQIHHKTSSVEFIAMDSAKNSLQADFLTHTVKLGDDPKSLGCGANPEKGRQAALQSSHQILDCFQNTDMIILVAGLGGGVGSGSLPVIAKIARQVCSVVVCFTVMPFPFEGKKRTQYAQETYNHLQEEQVVIVMLSNKRVLQHFSPRTSLVQILSEVGLQLTALINNFIGIIMSPSLINIDFSDMRTIFSGGGRMYIGSSSGSNETEIKIEQALKNEILELFDFSQANRSILLIEAGSEFNLGALYDIGESLEGKSDNDVELIMGVNLSSGAVSEIRITIFMLAEFIV